MRGLFIFSLSLINFSYATNSNFECSGAIKNTGVTQSIKWYRDSAEKIAGYRQVYALATYYINEQVTTHHLKPKTWGVVIDIDETVLDNSLYFKNCGELADNEDDFSKYVDLKEFSKVLPGAKNFTCTVHKTGGYVSLVSNRDGAYRGGDTLKATINNLKKEGVCFDQVILANRYDNINASDKSPRFNAVEYAKYDAKLMVWSNKLPKHKVIAYLGDNIQDFPKLKQEKMSKLVHDDAAFDMFGNGYFIFPNPMYGSWTSNQAK